MTIPDANSTKLRYQIQGKLGEGGMAVVYHAFDTNLERDVAIKIIKGEKFEGEHAELMVKRFDREVKMLAKLTHPNIVHIYDYGRYQAKPYLIMEYLSGGTLEDRIKKGKLPYQEAAQLLLPIAEALDYAHRQGILHRDVKPANIIFTADGKPLLSDFGIAKILGTNLIDESAQSLTQTGMGLGTPDYMAPEQWHGKFSPQTDIYALGVVFFEMITGRKPFIAETPAAFILQQMMEDPPNPADLVADLPNAVSNFILHTLEKEESDRHENMQLVIEELKKFAAGNYPDLGVYQPSTRMMKPAASSASAEQPPLISKEIESQETENAGVKKASTVGKIANGFWRVLQQLLISLTIVAVVLSIILVIGAMYVFGLFSRQAIQNAFYDEITRKETYRMTEQKLNENLDTLLMPYFEDFVDDIDADVTAPDILDFTLYRGDNQYHLFITIEQVNGYPQFSVEKINDRRLLFVRGIMSNQINRGMRRVMDENQVLITQFDISDDEINYTVTPIGE